MVGTAFQVEIDDDEVSKSLALLQRSLSDLTPVMKEIGGVAIKLIDLSFKTESDPYGNPWEPLKKETIAKRRKGEASGKSDKILRDFGILANSFRYSADRDSVAIGVPPVSSGTNMIYAATHQFGDDTRNIPARPFLPLEEKGLPGSLQDAIVDITNKFIEKSLGRG